MRINIENGTIRIDNFQKGSYSVFFRNPFNCFITLDLNKAKVTYNLDGKNNSSGWVTDEELFKKILLKTAYETKRSLFAKASFAGHIQMEKEGCKAIIEGLYLQCTTQELEAETPWEKREREEMERLQKIIPNVKTVFPPKK